MADELRFQNSMIEFDSKTRMVSLNDLWSARTDEKAMAPIVWLAQDVTQAYLKRLAGETGIRPRLGKLTPSGGRTRSIIIAIDQMIDATQERIFAAPEIATLYARRLGSDVFSWASEEINSLPPAQQVSQSRVKEVLDKFQAQELGPFHLDLPEVHFDVLSPWTGNHGDHSDHADNPDV